MNLFSLIRRLLHDVKETFITGTRVLTSRERFKSFFSVSLYRNAIYVVSGRLIVGAIGFVFWILAARLYTTEQVGLASAVIAIAGFLVTLSSLGLEYGLVRFIPASGKNHNALVNSAFTVGGLTAIVVSLVFLAGLNVWSPSLVFLRQNPFYIVIFVALAVTWLFYILLHNVYVAHQRAELRVLIEIIQGVVKLVLLVSLATFLYIFGVLVSWATGFAVAAIAGLFILLPRLQKGYRPSFTINKKVVNELARFSLANYLAGLVAKVPTFVLPLMIVSLLGAEQNAYFYIAYAVISNALVLIPASLSLSLFAEGSHNEEGLAGYVRSSLKFSFLILIPLIALIFLAGDKILLLFGEGYSVEATRLLWVLALSALPLTVNNIYFYMKRVEKKMKVVINLSILAVAITLGLTYFLLPIMGIMGAGIGWLAGNGVVTLVIVGSLLKGRQGV